MKIYRIWQRSKRMQRMPKQVAVSLSQTNRIQVPQSRLTTQASLYFTHPPSRHLCTSVMETASSTEEPTFADGSSGLWLSLQVQTCTEALDSLKRHQPVGFCWFPLQRLTRSYKVVQKKPMREIQICDRYYDWGKDVASKTLFTQQYCRSLGL